MRVRVMLVVALVALVALPTLGAGGARAASGGAAAARRAAASFLARYALPSGRITRADQGGDTVSAGQSYGMLTAVAIGQRRRFALIWGWTQSHLQRPDSLLASHWVRGRVVDGQSASDADLDAARALILAGKRFHAPAYRRAGIAIARAILTRETVRIGHSLVLLAGSWAPGRKPAFVDPGYWAPLTFELLGAATHDRRFGRLEQSALRLAGALTPRAPHLPPDWATISSRGAATSFAGPPGPHHEATSRFSLDASRLPIRFAEACNRSARATAAAVWPFFSTMTPTQIGFAYALDGTLLARQQTPTMLVGVAAAAHAAGHDGTRDQLLAQADGVNSRFPTYFGAAWLALARLELQTRLLASCG